VADPGGKSSNRTPKGLWRPFLRSAILFGVYRNRNRNFKIFSKIVVLKIFVAADSLHCTQNRCGPGSQSGANWAIAPSPEIFKNTFSCYVQATIILPLKISAGCGPDQGCCKKTRPKKTHAGFFKNAHLKKHNKTHQKTHFLFFL